MPYIHDVVQNKQLLDKIIHLLTTAPAGSTQPYWKKVNSGSFQTDGYILKSTGKNGNDHIYIRFSYTVATHYLMLTVLEHYEPNAIDGLPGSITNESAIAYPYYNNTTYNESYPVEYHLSFDRNKIMLVLMNTKESNPTARVTSFVWAGMPERIDKQDKTNGAVFIACSTYAGAIAGNNTSSYINHGVGRMIKNRSQAIKALTQMVTLNIPTGNSTISGSRDVLLPDIYLEDNQGYEGIRAILDGVHPIYQDTTNLLFKDGDEIIKQGKRYTIMGIAYDGTKNAGLYPNSFPSTWIAFEQL